MHIFHHFFFLDPDQQKKIITFVASADPNPPQFFLKCQRGQCKPHWVYLRAILEAMEVIWRPWRPSL